MSHARYFGVRESHDNGSHWLSVSDLMAGLMMIFLFIAITYMRFIQVNRDQIEQVVVAANDTHLKIYDALSEEFDNDLERWNAELDRDTMTVRFKDPDILFDQNSDRLKDRFKEILADFFPRYVHRLSKFVEHIDEVRIEGHTSSEWRSETSEMDAYFLNMDLSQRRTRAVLEYCARLDGLHAEQEWMRRRIAAVGLSSGRLILTGTGAEDAEKSRRVEFTVKTNFETKLITIIRERSAIHAP